METWTQLTISLLVESSFHVGTGKHRYRFWDSDCAIPPPDDGTIRAQIRIDGVWQDMHFNTVWGRRYDPNAVGAWLKQKASNHFSADTGRHTYAVR